jgi:hypothetical protein
VQGQTEINYSNYSGSEDDFDKLVLELDQREEEGREK